MSSRFSPLLGLLSLITALTACKNELQSKNSDQRSQGIASAGKSADNRPTADIDKNASFMLIPKTDDDLNKRLGDLPQGTPLNIIDPAAGTSSVTDFYMGINKKELNSTWFLTASTKQLYPAINGTPFINLGTRVVKFAVQNGKLFIFDVDDRRTGSTVAAPTVVVDAYPIVPLTPQLEKLGLDASVIIFDPSAGLSQHGPVADLFARSNPNVSFQTDIKYLRNYNRVADGVYFEMVFSGVSNVDLTENGSVDALDSSPSRAVGTLGLTLRRYQEAPNFVIMDAANLNQSFYFTGAEPGTTSAGQNPNKGVIVDPVLKWGGIKKGMTPILFKITPEIKKTQALFPEYDVIGAVTKGIESWNEAIGFPIFKVVVGTAQDSWASDDTNMVIWDDTGSIPFAYADTRINPKTGEIRAGNIYMDVTWVYLADEIFSYLPLPAAAAAKPKGFIEGMKSTKRVSGFAWGGMKPTNMCSDRFEPAMVKARLAAFTAAKEQEQAETQAQIVDPTKILTNRKQAVENYIANVIAHEAGHVLGLRHNFKGSTFKDAETSSIMDYYDDILSAALPKPAAYDIDAIKYLYGLSPNQPAQAFCTDENVGADPSCQRFDYGIDPLKTMILANYSSLKKKLLAATDNRLVGPIANYMEMGVGFLLNGNPTQQTQAWEGLILDLRAVPPVTGAAPPKAVINELAKILVGLSFQSPINALAPFGTILAKDLAAIGLNTDGIRTMDARRLSADSLKTMQSDPGLQALTKLRTDLVARKATLTPADAVLEGDLIARVEKHLAPYFD